MSTTALANRSIPSESAIKITRNAFMCCVKPRYPFPWVLDGDSMNAATE